MADVSNIKDKVVHGVSWVGINSAVNAGSSILKVAVLTRLLDKSDFGLLTICCLFISLSSSLTDMGISAAVLHKQNIQKKVYHSLFWFNLMLGIGISLIIIACTPLIVDFYHDRRLWCLIPISTLDIVFNSITTLQRCILQKTMNFKVISIVQISANISGLVLSIIFALRDMGVYALLVSQIIASGMIASFFFYYGLVIGKTIGLSFVFSETLPFIRIGIFRVGSSLLYYITNNCDSILISFMFPLDTLGVYYLCKNLILHLYGIMQSAVTVFTPAFALYQDQKEKLALFFCQSVRSYAWIGFPVYTFVAIAAVPILRILYGESYGQYWIFLSLISLTYAMHSIQGISGALALAYGKTDWILCWEFFAAAVSSLIIAVIGYLTHSITVLVLSIFVFWFMTIFVLYPAFIVKRLLPVSWMQYWRTFVPVALLLAPPAFLFFLIRLLPAVLGILLCGVLFAGLYLFLTYIFMRNDFERGKGIVFSMIARRRAKNSIGG